VETAERFGFNHKPGIEGAAESTLPRSGEIQGELDLGSSAIGQGRVQASALQMAITAATVADGGRRPRPTFAPQANPAPAASVMSSSVAHALRRLMVAVVREGTGTSAAVPGVVVAGKTGTAELQSACSGGEAGAAERGASEAAESGAAPPCRGSDSDPANTDAWFAAFAPALKPRIVVAVLLVKDGAGGDTAAPVAREVLEAGLGAAR
jgi:cell division protein FtsI/penicillin-binding protein 2